MSNGIETTTNKNSPRSEMYTILIRCDIYLCVVIRNEEDSFVGTALVIHSTAILPTMCTIHIYIRKIMQNASVSFIIIIDLRQTKSVAQCFCSETMLTRIQSRLNDTPNKKFNSFCSKDCTKKCLPHFDSLDFDSNVGHAPNK